ncbi:MAG TPA: WxcM-like domain-containing protein [Chitinophagaceae bacterium]
MDELITGVQVTPLKHIPGNAGDIFHIMKNDSPGFDGFGEVYISTVKPGSVKGWKRHTRMTLNIVVPLGKIRFVVYDEGSKKIQEVILSPDNYNRLTVPPGLWMAFRCEADQESFLVNFANIVHDPAEAENLAIDNNVIPYEWK